MVLGFIRKQTQQAVNKQDSNQIFLRGLCISTCLHVPALVDFLSWLPLMIIGMVATNSVLLKGNLSKHFIPQDVLVMVFNHSNSIPKKEKEKKDIKSQNTR